MHSNSSKGLNQGMFRKRFQKDGSAATSKIPLVQTILISQQPYDIKYQYSTMSFLSYDFH